MPLNARQESVSLSSLLRKTRISEEEPTIQPLLGDLQCNILSPHALCNSDYFFVRFRDHDHARYLLGMLARAPDERESILAASPADRDPPQVGGEDGLSKSVEQAEGPELDPFHLRSELEVRRLRSRLSGAKRIHQEVGKDIPSSPERCVINVLLTRTAYDKLRLDPPGDAAFRAGMKARADRLNDPNTTIWSDQVDALVIASYNDERPFKGCIEHFRRFVAKHADLVHAEAGKMLEASTKTQSRCFIEPFGFRDGLSQPLFYASDLGRRKTNSGKSFATSPHHREREIWDESAPLSLVLCPDPHGQSPHACGSYIVVRKLAQDIETFYAQANQLAGVTGREPTEELARLMGRQQQGTPLGGTMAGPLNDFMFTDDPRGETCPFFSHVRKCNPRGDIKRNYNARRHRIVRRSVPYGPAIQRDERGVPQLHDGSLQYCDPNQTGEIGIVFQCAQSDIVEQFEHIQALWLNNPHYPSNCGADPVVGRLQNGRTNRIRIRRSDGEHRFVDFGACVELRDGAYFFAPSIGFLKGLIGDVPTTDHLAARKVADMPDDSRITYDEQTNTTAGYVNIQDGDEPLQRPYRQRLLYLMAWLAYTQEGRDFLRENGRDQDEEVIRNNLTDKFQNDFGITNDALLEALIEGHLAAIRWILFHKQAGQGEEGAHTERQKQERIYQQNLAFITWSLWEDALDTEFSLLW